MPMPTIDRLRKQGRKAFTVGRCLSIVELVLLALLMIQAARLVWAVVTPVGSFGDWRGRQAEIPSYAARQALFVSFDPFFRTTGGGDGNAVVTSLSITLFGVRVNEGSGQGSAIIATPDGVQNSFAVGDEILPGVLLKAVAFDHITIDRGGAEETVFLDQSQAVPAAASEGAVVPLSNVSSLSSPLPIATSVRQGPQHGRSDLTTAALKSDVGFTPRSHGGRVTGLVLMSRGPAFDAAGFKPGDIISQVNGRPIASASDLQAFQSQLVPGARISLAVERGAAVVPIALILQGQ